MLQFKLIINGRVQGVGYRAAALKKANELQLKGWVKNTEDGDVLLVAQGDETKLEHLIRWCNKGPVSARVESLSVEEEKVTEIFTEFCIVK